MAKHDTMSAWFWMANSWLSTGGLLFFLRKPMARPLGSSPLSQAADCRRLGFGGGWCLPAAASRLPVGPLGVSHGGVLRRSGSVRVVSPQLACLGTVMKMHRSEPPATAGHPLSLPLLLLHSPPPCPFLPDEVR